MKCPRCGNSDERYFFKRNGQIICRKCIQYSSHQKMIQNKLPHSVNYVLEFELSSRQKEISQALLNNYLEGKNSLVLAVCGSGKTEITFHIIQYVLNNHQRVCFTIPRKSLCVELYDRFTQCFSSIDIGLIYGGVCRHSEAPFIICTTHQLYRFVEDPFDLVLIDEADAFPFYGDEVLGGIFNQTAKQYIKMSATLTSKDIHNEEILIMNRRYHNHDLPIPIIKHRPQIMWKLYLHQFISHNKNKPLLLYVPQIKDVAYYESYFSRFYKVKGVSSSTQNINDYLELLKNKQLDFIITTTILERGITIEDVQVIVVNSAHSIFDERCLMQICGRVGRKPNHPSGTIIFLDATSSKEMKQCIKTIIHLNTMNV